MHQEYKLGYQKMFQLLRSEQFPIGATMHVTGTKIIKTHFCKINSFFAPLRI